MRHTAQQIRHTQPNIWLWMTQPRKQLRNDSCCRKQTAAFSLSSHAIFSTMHDYLDTKKTSHRRVQGHALILALGAVSTEHYISNFKWNLCVIPAAIYAHVIVNMDRSINMPLQHQHIEQLYTHVHIAITKKPVHAFFARIWKSSNSAQLEGNPPHSSVILGCIQQCRNRSPDREIDRHTHTYTNRRWWPIYISLGYAQCEK